MPTQTSESPPRNVAKLLSLTGMFPPPVGRTLRLPSPQCLSSPGFQPFEVTAAVVLTLLRIQAGLLSFSNIHREEPQPRSGDLDVITVNDTCRSVLYLRKCGDRQKYKQKEPVHPVMVTPDQT